MAPRATHRSSTPARRRGRTRAPVWAAACAVLLAAPGCGSPHQAAGDEQPPVPLVETLAALAGTLPLEERVSGVVRARNQVTIRPEIEAPIVEVFLRNGDAVRRGDPLVRLEDTALREQVRRAEASVRVVEASAAEARAEVAELEAQVSRTRTLAAEALISELEVETQEARLAAAEAALAQANATVDESRAALAERRSALSKTLVRAPVAGRVGRRNAEVGLLADPATPLFVLGDPGELIVEIPLTEEMLRHVEPGMPVRIDWPASAGEPVRAELSRVSPFLEPGSFSTVGEIDVSNAGGRLRPGMFVTVDVLYGESERATLVPSAALWEDPRSGDEGVFVVEQSGTVAASPAESEDAGPTRASFRRVEVLAEGHGVVGVRGVDEGEWVVTVGQHLLASAGEPLARVRPTSWERVQQLQALQDEDLLRRFFDRQQRYAREHGVVPPTSEQFLHGGDAAPAAGSAAGP